MTYIDLRRFELTNDLFRALGSDPSSIDRWATGPNDYWPRIQVGLADLPMEMNALSERVKEQCKRDDEVINEHLDMLVELLQGYKVNLFLLDEIPSLQLDRIYANDWKTLSITNKKRCKKPAINRSVPRLTLLTYQLK